MHSLPARKFQQRAVAKPNSPPPPPQNAKRQEAEELAGPGQAKDNTSDDWIFDHSMALSQTIVSVTVGNKQAKPTSSNYWNCCTPGCKCGPPPSFPPKKKQTNKKQHIWGLSKFTLPGDPPIAGQSRSNRDRTDSIAEQRWSSLLFLFRFSLSYLSWSSSIHTGNWKEAT